MSSKHYFPVWLSFSAFLCFRLFVLFYQLLLEYLNTTTTTATTTTVVPGGVVVGVPGYSCCIKVSLLTTGMASVLALISLEMLDGCASDANWVTGHLYPNPSVRRYWLLITISLPGYTIPLPVTLFTIHSASAFGTGPLSSHVNHDCVACAVRYIGYRTLYIYFVMQQTPLVPDPTGERDTTSPDLIPLVPIFKCLWHSTSQTFLAMGLHYLLLHYIQIHFTILVPAHPCCPGQRAVKQV